MDSVKLTLIKCKSCKKRFKSNSILKHLSQATKKNCISIYTESELKTLKEQSSKHAKSKEKEWKRKNKKYYKGQRADYYKKNKAEIAKKKSEYHAKKKKDVAKKHAQNYQNRKFFKLCRQQDYRIALSVLSNQCTSARLNLQKKINSIKEWPNGIKKKTIKFIEKETSNTLAFLDEKRDALYQKIEDHRKTIGITITDIERQIFDLMFHLKLLTDQRLDILDCFLQDSKDCENDEAEVKEIYMDMKNEYSTDYEREESKIDKKIIKIQTKILHQNLKERLAKWRNDIGNREDYVNMDTFNYAKETVSYFLNNSAFANKISTEIKQDMKDVFDMIDKKMTELHEEFEEVFTEVNDVICQWNCGTDNWRQKNATDIEFLEDSFKNLMAYLKCEFCNLKHTVYIEMHNICKHIKIESPKKPFFKEVFDKCTNKYCHCSDFK